MLACLLLAGSQLAIGQCSKTDAFNCAYTTDGAGGNIYAVDRTTGTVIKIVTISGKTLNDVRVGADNMLYVTSNNSILRVNEDGSGKVTHVFDATKAIPGPFNGIRFSPLGDAYINTRNGVYRVGPDSSGNHLIQIPGPTFPTPVLLMSNSASCSSAGGLAVWPTGDLLIANNTYDEGHVQLCTATNGVVSRCTGQFLLSTSDPITGLAVDALANVLVANGNTVAQYTCTTTSCGNPTTLATFTKDYPAYIDTAPFPPGLPPNHAGTSDPSCNSAAVTTFVSTADRSGKNGKVWTVNTVDQNCGSNVSLDTLASISKSQGAVGMGVGSASRTLTKLFPSLNSAELFYYGPFEIQITPENVNPGCSLSLTAQREDAAALDAILAIATDAKGNVVPSTAIPFDGEQGWRTSFHGGYPASGCTSNMDSHIGITGAIQYVNPWIALIDDSTGRAILDPIPSVYPGFELDGVPGDPIKITNSGLFTANDRIVLVDRGMTANNGQGYTFVGFLPPIIDPPTQPGDNSENSGKSFVLKFQLLANGSPITDAQGFAVTTGLSIARLTCDASAGDGCPGDQQMSLSAEGNSGSPPSFNFKGGGNGQFHFNVDTKLADGTEWCNGVYEATANSDSFSPHTVLFEIVRARPYPACF